MSDITFVHLYNAEARIHRELPGDTHNTMRAVALLAKKEKWRVRKIYGLRAVCSQDLDAWIAARKAAKR